MWAASSLPGVFQATLLTVPAGHNFDESWRLIRKSILEVLLQNGPKMRVIQEKYPHKSSSFFSMYRFDFMLHKDGSPYLMEVRKACGPAAWVGTFLSSCWSRAGCSALGALWLPAGLPCARLDVMAHT